jgi:1,4-dihydroxy-6-naphthoate synthase
VIDRAQSVIRASLDYAMAHPDEALVSMRRHAQEFDDGVLMQHVDLYVNPWTRDLGETGRAALDSLSTMAKSIGLVDRSAAPLSVWPE